jgi:hypothetical protein
MLPYSLCRSRAWPGHNRGTHRPPPSPSPSPSPVQGKNVSARASMGPAARPSAGTQQGFALASPRAGGRRPLVTVGIPRVVIVSSASALTVAIIDHAHSGNHKGACLTDKRSANERKVSGH